MKEIKVTVNTWYVVEGAAGATVINPLTNRAIATVEDGKQASFLATTPYVVASDDSVNVFKAPFNSAPAKLMALGLLGGGNSELPAGYLQAEFLEITGYINTGDSLSPHFQVPLPTIENSDNWEFVTSHAVDFSTGAAQVEGVNAHGSVQSMFYGVTAGNKLYAGSGNGVATSTAVDVNEQKHSFAFRQKGQLSYVAFDGEEFKLKANTTIPPSEIGLFVALKRGSAGFFYPFNGKKYSWKFIKNGKVIRNLIPSLDAAGTPCMFDLVTKQTFYNSGPGQFIVGFTLPQARKLGKLPARTKLSVSLPVGYDSDAGVVAALAEAEANGCVLTIRTYEAAASATSTFGMRRIWVRRTQSENGLYVDAEGTRWQVDWCVTMYTPDDSTPDMHGYELFRSVEAATEYWGLEPYVDPAWEEELLTETN